MRLTQIEDEYFEWMCNLVCGTRFPNDISYTKLLAQLHNTVFTYTIPMDANRADDGISLRYRFSIYRDYEDYLEDALGRASILEVMVALAIKCEEIMDDPRYGDRTAQWFWYMIGSLGLNGMTNDRYDRQYVTEVLTIFLNREYTYYGKGGLFYVRNPRRDMRDIEIWHQLMEYVDSI